MLDVAITGATVVDGTGAPGRRADVGIRDGRIVAVGVLDEPAVQTVDADGLTVAPGFVDPHTHYDAQLHWDPLATPSSWHGVTTVIGGNCGFTLAPLKERDADYTRRMMAQVEGMPLAALEDGLPWSWESFGEFLDALDGAVGVNAGFMVGHCALRRYVLGDDFARAVDRVGGRGDQRAARPLAGRRAGSGCRPRGRRPTSTARAKPVPSRWAVEDEVYSLCEVVAQHDGTSLELITQGCIGRFSDDEVELLAQMSRVAGRPLNWNVLSPTADEPDKVEHQLRPSRAGPGDRWSRPGADHAGVRRQQHELPHVLRAVVAARLARDARGRRAGTHPPSAGSRGPRHSRRECGHITARHAGPLRPLRDR